MFKRILVLGGAGFIGSHIVDALIQNSYKVRVLDNLDPQVHGKKREPPDYLNPKAEFILGDIQDTAILKKALKGIDVVFHKAAKVGVGQSMYRITDYVEANTLATANLLQVLIDYKYNIKKLIIASSMSLYGEGAYKCKKCGLVFPDVREHNQFKKHEWENKCPYCQKVVFSIPTNENKPLFPTSIYAINKRDQEEMCLRVGLAYKIPTVALRYFNVYGPRQALSNPYTGVVAIFSGCIINNDAPLIFEDGLQSRDFIHVSDVVEANMLTLEKDEANYQVFNVGAGRRITVLDIATILLKKLNQQNIKPKILNKFREGDIRHCYADITKIQKILKFSPKVNFEDGMDDLIEWVRTQQLAINKIEQATNELKTRGLVK